MAYVRIIIAAMAAFLVATPSSAQESIPKPGVIFASDATTYKQNLVSDWRVRAIDDAAKFMKSTEGKKLQIADLDSGLTLIYDPKITLDQVADSILELTSSIDAQGRVTFDRLPPQLRDLINSHLYPSNEPILPDPSNPIQFHVDHSVLFVRDGKMLDLSSDPAGSSLKKLQTLLDDSKSAGKVPESERRDPTAPFPQGFADSPPAIVYDSGEPQMEKQALAMKLAGTWIQARVILNIKRIKEAQIDLVTKLMGQAPLIGERSRSLDALSDADRAAIMDSLRSGYGAFGFKSANEAIDWISGAQIKGQWYRPMLFFSVGGSHGGLDAAGIQFVPSLLR